MLLIYSNPKTWAHPMFLYQDEELTEQERASRLAAFESLLEDLNNSGELVDSAPLADPSTSRVVRLKDGVEDATDGPFAEAKEQLAGYFVIDCDGIERATEVAARFPDARFGGVEIRPIMSTAGLEM
jgi:hypothetical protein